MQENRYVKLFKEVIIGKVKEFENSEILSIEFFNDLFPKISTQIRSIAVILNYPEVDDETLFSYFEVAKKEYLSVNPVDIETSNVLTKDSKPTWLTEKRESEIKWHYTQRYLQAIEESGRSDTVIKDTKNSSLGIMGKLGDPKSTDEFYVRGLVVGEVQSGKTANFNGVLNRAIDCGYKLIIVLSGIMEDLRIQTQQRIESDVIGEGLDIETDAIGVQGVGKINRFGPMGGSDIEQVVSITSSKSDFKKGLADANFSLNHTNVLVCKKNIGVLKNLIVWLHDHLDPGAEQHNIPFLILDDEADNASLNNEGHKGVEYASRTNGYIRVLLQLFHRKSYLGYTATPFANVLQDRNEASENYQTIRYRDEGVDKEKRLSQVSNIFPDDFIILLSSPTNYVGAKQIFETITPINNSIGEKLPLVIPVDDHILEFPSRVFEDLDGNPIGVENYQTKEEWDEAIGPYSSYLHFADFREYRRETRSSRKDDPFPRSLPDSLIDALLCFILAVSVRESRKPAMIKSVLYQPHNTMLIHISRFTAWQNATKLSIEEYLREIKYRVDNDALSNPNSIFSSLENKWYQYYAEIIESIGGYLPNGYTDDFMVPITFESLKSYLPDVLRSLEVKAINSSTGDKLIYKRKSPKNVIAIGGNRLSRGFTLEGLSINYFIRTTNYSDTLLQMGRWFGYRPGFLDCCKLFTTLESIDKFNLTTRCIEELEFEFKKMEKLNKSPENFVVRVKKHPGVLKITRPSILKNTIDVKWSFQDQLEMTTQFDVRKDHISNVWNSFKSTLVPKFNSGRKVGDFLTFNTDALGIIDILESETNYPKDVARSMIQFIKLCKEKELLTSWLVALRTKGQASPSKGQGVIKSSHSGLRDDVGMAVRRGPSHNAPAADKKEFLERMMFRATGKSANILSSNRDMSLLLSEPDIESAEWQFRLEKIKELKHKNPTLSDDEIEKKITKTFPERIYRERMKENQGLLVIYLFDSYYSFNQEKGAEFADFSEFVSVHNHDLSIPLIGFALGFPPIEDDPGGVYVQGDYDINDEITEEMNNEDSILPVIEE